MRMGIEVCGLMAGITAWNSKGLHGELRHQVNTATHIVTI